MKEAANFVLDSLLTWLTVAHQAAPSMDFLGVILSGLPFPFQEKSREVSI